MSSSSSGKKKKSYSVVYKIYRRMRYMRYLKKKKRRILREKREAEVEEKKEVVRLERERLKTERYLTRQKRKKDKLVAKTDRKAYQEEIRETLKETEEQASERRARELIQKAKDKADRKKRRNRLLRAYIKLSVRSLKRSILSLNWRNFKKKYRSFVDNRQLRKEFYTIAFNSTTMFILSYLVVYMMYQLISIATAKFFDYPVIWYYWDVYYNISPEDWFMDSVKTIFSSGPLILLMIGMIFLIIYFQVRELNGRFKLFFLWGFLHTVSLSFGAVLVGTLFQTGLGHVADWMYIQDTGKVLYSIISLFILVMAGAFTTKSFIISANSYYNNINAKSRGRFMFAQVFVPYIIGTLIMILVRYPLFMHYETFMMVTMLISLLPVFVLYRTYNDLYFEEEKPKINIHWIVLFMTILVLVFYRGVLDIGIRFDW